LLHGRGGLIRALMKSFLRYWLPVLVWMAVIFSASADSESVEHTSRFLEPFLRWLKPDISAEAIDTVRTLIRKCAHVTEFAVLAALLWRALRSRCPAGEWSWKTAGLAFVIAVIYAATDEFHQLFVETRTGSAVDVLIDSFGAALALGALWILRRRRRVSP
jgi:VanZ family protein